MELPYPFGPYDFMRQDEGDDSLFYREPRLVVHIDNQAIAAIGELFREVFSPVSPGGSPQGAGAPQRGPVILDLMSSWRSHWPKGLAKARMVGLGLNAVEMGRNPDLDDYVVHDLNRDPELPAGDASFDGVAITVSVQYLVRPIEVFREVDRVLKPGGVFLVIFSNRMFFTKAVRIWVMGGDGERMELVATYMRCAGNFENITRMYLNPERGEMEDPVYAVVARKAAASR
jgi:SAM-dependent methyltransferase